MAQGVGITRLVKKIMEPWARKSRYDEGKWHATRDTPDGPFHLFHYSTEMLRWDRDSNVLGSWTGWGSVSDAQGVNAALRALGSPLHFYRDRKGGGPRINPRNAFVVGKVSSVSAISPATPYWMR